MREIIRAGLVPDRGSYPGQVSGQPQGRPFHGAWREGLTWLVSRTHVRGPGSGAVKRQYGAWVLRYDLRLFRRAVHQIRKEE